MKVNRSYFFVTLLCILFSFSLASAQYGKLPPFRMMQANGKVFNAQQLPMGKPIVLIYFSPECDHCQKLMGEVFKKIESFKKASIAMITYLPVDKVTKFVSDYKTNKYTNIYVGTEGNSFFLRNYYRIDKMPFMCLYNKDGYLQMLYTKEELLPDLIKRLASL